MIRISLNKAEREQLIRLREGGISEHSEKILMVLLSDQGKSPINIAEQIQRNPHTVRDWLKRYQKEGINGFQREYSPGRPNRIRKSITSIIKDIIEESPTRYGFQSNSWTAQLMVDYLRKHGIKSSIDTVKRALKDLGYTYKRPSKTVPKTAPGRKEKTSHMLKLLERIKEEIQQGECELYALDETGFSTDPYLHRGWIKRGQKKTSVSASERKTNAVWCLKSKDKTYLLEEYRYRK